MISRKTIQHVDLRLGNYSPQGEPKPIDLYGDRIDALKVPPRYRFTDDSDNFTSPPPAPGPPPVPPSDLNVVYIQDIPSVLSPSNFSVTVTQDIPVTIAPSNFSVDIEQDTVSSGTPQSISSNFGYGEYTWDGTETEDFGTGNTPKPVYRSTATSGYNSTLRIVYSSTAQSGDGYSQNGWFLVSDSNAIEDQVTFGTDDLSTAPYFTLIS